MADWAQVHSRMSEVSGEEWKATGENRPEGGLKESVVVQMAFTHTLTILLRGAVVMCVCERARLCVTSEKTVSVHIPSLCSVVSKPCLFYVLCITDATFSHDCFQNLNENMQVII